MLNVLKASGIIQEKIGVIEEFTKKYNLDLPFKTVEEFKTFDELLSDQTSQDFVCIRIYEIISIFTSCLAQLKLLRCMTPMTLCKVLVINENTFYNYLMTNNMRH